MGKKKLAIIGCGKLAGIIVNAFNDGFLPDYRFVGVLSRSRENAQNLLEKINHGGQKGRCKLCESIDEVIAARPDIVIETATPQAFKNMGIPVLKEGISIITLSIGALADDSFREELKSICLKSGAKVHIASGAIGGFDVLKTTALMGDSKASIKTTKGPDSLKGTSVYEESLQEKEKKVFSGDAKEAISLFPTRVNVAVAASLASVGPENMEVSITSVPEYTGDDHRIEIENEQVKAVVDVYSKTSEIAGWSVVYTLQNIASPIVFQ